MNYLTKGVSALFFLFCCCVILDPPNTLFRIKHVILILLLLLLGVRYNKINIHVLCILLILYILFVSAFLRGYLFGYEFDFGVSAQLLMSFVMLSIAFWIHKIEIFRYTFIPFILMSLVSVSIAIVMLFYPDIEPIVYEWTESHQHFIMMARRSFLGIDIIAVYYRSSSMLIVPFCVYAYKLTCNRYSPSTLLICLLFFACLFFSGTRANMLSAVFVVVLSIALKTIKELGNRMIIPLFLIIFFCSFYLVYLLLLEKDEASNAIKFSHLDSYLNLFYSHPDILLFGQGIGAIFYSEGFQSYTMITEWSYIELIRTVGLGGLLVVLLLLCLPIILLWHKRDVLTYSYPMMMGYILYLMIAGTNPLLLSSSGYLIILIVYNYALNPIYRTNFHICK